MLQTEAIDPATLELIKSLQGKSYLDGFYLVGGTAIALYLGHRQSIDYDLFCEKPFAKNYVYSRLNKVPFRKIEYLRMWTKFILLFMKLN